MKEATSKWRGLLARLSLLFHCVELAEARHAGERPDPITMRTLKATTVEKACRFIMRVVVPSTFRFHTEIGSAGSSETHARWVAGYILSRELQSITARDIGRAYREIRGKPAEIVATMELLVHAGWVLPDPAAAAYRLAGQSEGTHGVRCPGGAEKARREAVREQVGRASRSWPDESVPNVTRAC